MPRLEWEEAIGLASGAVAENTHGGGGLCNRLRELANRTTLVNPGPALVPDFITGYVQ